MFKNYLKIALRNMERHKGYSLINIFGLAVGMSCMILILLWIQDELSYDRFHKNAKEIYRLVPQESGIRYAVSHAPIGHTLKEDYSEIVSASRVSIGEDRSLLKYQDKRFEQNGKMVDPDFLKIFSFSFVKGNPDTALNDPTAIVLSESLAKKLFDNKEPIGEIIHVDDHIVCKVTGVFENIPHNSHLQFDFLRPFVEGEWSQNWNDWSYYTYIQLQKNSSILEMNQKINDCFKKHKSPAKNIAEYTIQPLNRIHLYSNFKFDVEGNSDIQYVYIFTIIAIFILLIACINFMNLSTARSANRAKEIGIRKVVGSARLQVMKQFFGESILIAFLAFIIAIFLVVFLLPIFNDFSGKHLSFNYLEYPLILSSIAIIIITGIVAGSYPAILLSSHKPINVLRTTTKLDSKGENFRKILVVTQFTLSIGLIISTMVVANQFNFMKNAKLGFDKENLLYLQLRGINREKIESLKTELLRHPNIVNASVSNSLLNEMLNGTSGAEWEGKAEDKRVQMQFIAVDYDYMDTFKMQMAQGRFFSKEFATDIKEAVILNQAAIKAMELESPIGKRFKCFWKPDARIIGVIKDFHYRPLREELKPIILGVVSDRINYLTIRTKPIQSGVSDLIHFLENKWKEYNYDYPFEFHFLDDTIDELYAAEQRMSTIYKYFTFLAICIACLGLFGLASYSAERRTKEIGIRKVMGASVPGIIGMLTKDFLKWVLFSNIIAWPIAWYAMNTWLQNFAYRVNIGIWTFILSASLALIIALVTVSYQSMKAALANPVESLSYE
ncbi:MAG: ABC transporter permease [Gemmatimonadota bacterium]|nr:MAG: ABC transporter permease [Gemmatimonadota bacterium]